MTAPNAGADEHPELRFYVRLAVLLLLGGFLLLVYRIIEPIWRPLVWAGLLGILLTPIQARALESLNGRKALASGLTMLIAVTFFLIPVMLISSAVSAQAANLLKTLESIVPASAPGQTLDVTRMRWLARPIEWLASHLSITRSQLQEWLLTGAREGLQGMMSSGGSLVMGTVGTLISTALMLFVLFFVLRDGPRLAASVVRLLPIEPSLRGKLWRHLIDVTRAVFMGIGLTAIVQGFLFGVGFAIAGLPSPLVFGVLGALFALVPVVGTAVIWVPATLWLLLQGETGYALFIAGWGIIAVGSVDNFLRPILISGRVEVPTLAVFIGVMGGLSAFGFVGLFLGPIVLGLLVALFRFTTEALAPAANEE